MRVLFLAQHVTRPDDVVPPHGSGSHAAATLAGLRQHHDVLALFADGSGAGDSHARRAARRLVPGWLRALRHDLRALRADRRFASRAAAAAREFRPDVVYARSEYLCLDGVRVARRLGVPLVLEVNGLLAQDVRSMYRSPLEPLGAALERYKHRRAGAIVTVSPGLAELLEDHGADRRKVAVVPNSVSPQRVRRRPASAREPVVVGWIGHLMQWHVEALELLIDASPAVPGISFLIIGGGPGLDDLEARARAAGVAGRFRFLGAVPYDEVPERLEEIDVGVIPAVFEYAFPVKLVEFGAAGIPVVAPRSESLDAQLVPHEEYEPFTAGDGVALAEALAGLAADAERRELLGRALQRAVTERYTWDVTGRALRDIVDRVVAGRRVSSGS
jgi:glycosyltransferase involved in cell wall biosynthesis